MFKMIAAILHVQVWKYNPRGIISMVKALQHFFLCRFINVERVAEKENHMWYLNGCLYLIIHQNVSCLFCCFCKK